VGGSPRYAWAILRCLKFYHLFCLEMHSDAQDFAGDITFATIGNNRPDGGGATMTPRARPDYGLPDVCIVLARDGRCRPSRHTLTV
jgi:diacylglycerol kinase family enzyme